MTETSTVPPLPTADTTPPRQPKLLERMRIHLRTRHYSIRTEEAYLDWARRFIYFHGKQRCPTCRAIEKYTKEVVYNDFAKFVKSGKVRFKEVDISTPQGEKIADKYRVSWSSLYVNGWNNGKEKRNDLTRMGFKYARNNTAQFKTELKKKINQLLK